MCILCITVRKNATNANTDGEKPNEINKNLTRIDKNALTASALQRTLQNPDQNVVRWMSGIDESRLFLSVLTIGEIHKGIEKLPEGRKKENLHDWVNSDLTERFNNRILPFDLRAAAVWGEIQVRSELSGKTMPIMDGLIAASAISYQLTVVTRNISDMEFSGALLFNPWDAG